MDAISASDARRPAPVGAKEIPPGFMYRWGRGVCRIWVDLWFELKVYGRHHVPRHGGILIVSNHQSYLDPVLLGTKLIRPLSFMAKSELFENPYFGWMIRNLNAFPVRQGEGDVGALKETIRQLQAGHALNVFPEGTRSPDGELQPLEPGVGLIVRRAGVPVVPAVIYGSYDAWPRDDKLFHRHPIRVEFGPPMHLADLKAAAIVRRIETTLRVMFDQLRERTRQEWEARRGNEG
jgi:1-acyl-sn-glycerol-3-phosphate acyltransferase